MPTFRKLADIDSNNKSIIIKIFNYGKKERVTENVTES